MLRIIGAFRLRRPLRQMRHTFMSAICIAAIIIFWLRSISPEPSELPGDECAAFRVDPRLEPRTHYRAWQVLVGSHS